MRPQRLLLAAATIGSTALIALAAAATPALAVRGHVFGSEFGSVGSADGQLSEPEALAVNEASHDVYVADKGNNRVQWFDASGAKVEGQLTGTFATGSGTTSPPSATGAGDLSVATTSNDSLTNGSNVVDFSCPCSGTFTVGMTIAGETPFFEDRIPPGTTITAVGANTLTLSAAYTSTSKATNLPLRGSSPIVTNLATSTGVFAVGQTILGSGIPSGTTITKVGPGATLELSNIVAQAGSAVVLSAGSLKVTGVTATVGAFAVGQEISGAGIEAGTTITAVDSVTGVVQISQFPTASGTVPLTAQQPFYRPQRIAVDNACKLREEGTHIPLSPAECAALDPSDGDVYVETEESRGQVVDKFTAAGAFVGEVAGPVAPSAGAFTGGVEGLAVDPHGRLFVLEHPNDDLAEQQGIDRYSNALANVFTGFVKASITARGATANGGFAVDGVDNLFVRTELAASNGEAGLVFELDEAGHPVALDNENRAAPVGGELGVGFNGVGVELSSGDLYLESSAGVRRFGPFQMDGNPLIEEFGEGDLQAAPCGEEASCRGGLAVDSASGAVFVSVGSESRVVRFVLEPPAAPKIQEESVSEVTSRTVKLAAEVNPRSEPFERPTSYYFQYLTEAQYQENVKAGVEPFEHAAQTPTKLLAPSYELSGVGVPVGGLLSGTSYRYRLVATNHCKAAEPSVVCATAGEVGEHGEEVARVFRTEPAAGFGLLDGRGFELVSPVVKLGALISPLGRFSEFAMQAAAGGGGVTYVASTPTEGGAAGNGGRTQVLSFRTASGWETRDLAVPQERAIPVTEHPVWPVFSEDLSLAAVQPLGPFDQSLSPAGSEQTAYVYSDFQGGASPSSGTSEACTVSCFTPLVTGVNAPGVEFGVNELGPENKSELCPPDPYCGPQFEAASPDLQHVVVHSRVALVEPAGSTGGLFEVSGGAVTFLGTGVVGAGLQPAPTNFVSPGPHAVSVDGSRVIIKGSAGGLSGLLLRDSVTGETLKLGGPQAAFVTASADDSRVFFENTNGGPLEECEVIEGESGELHCNTIDVSPGVSVFAPVPGASEDGTSVYFVATGVIAGVEPGPGGEVPQAGQPNLYLYQSGSTRLVAVLSTGDASDWGEDTFLSQTGPTDPLDALATSLKYPGLTARVSPDGHWLAFVSGRSLTGYDNHDAASPEKTDSEVYLYHAPTNGQPASLVCASCDPTGARPTGSSTVPGWTNGLYQSRYLSNGGRLFFDTPDQLVPQDTNKAGDVYEYEPPAGATGGEEPPTGDSCATGSPAYDPTAGGCVDLISTGSSPEPSSFLDATENGDEVFFLTTAQISKRDTDTSYDVYDARIGGSEPEPAKPVECQGDACQTPVAPPENLTPGSLTFTGPGNLLYTAPTKPAVKKKAVKCSKGKTRNKKGRCVRKPKANRRGKSKR